MHEFDLIRRLASRAPTNPSVLVGIGDDTALLHSTHPQAHSLVTTDLLAEGTHFTIPPATPRQIGHKALAVNLSDIAAMAGRPVAAFIALLLPRARGSDFAEELFDGLRDLAARHHVAIAGGDTNVWDGPLVICVTLTGEPTPRGPVLRSGARPGDWLFVTGPLGGSLAGRHLAVTPRIAEAQALHAAVDLHAMLDLSDGLSRDLRHLTTDHNLGATLDASAIPIHPDVPLSLSPAERLSHALHDGEDFELLFALSPDDALPLLQSPPLSTPLFPIGRVTNTPGLIELQYPNGTRTPLDPLGYEHRF